MTCYHLLFGVAGSCAFPTPTKVNTFGEAVEWFKRQMGQDNNPLGILEIDPTLENSKWHNIDVILSYGLETKGRSQ